MREIKFRGKCMDNGEWLYGDLVQSPDKLRKAIFASDMERDDECEVFPSSVGQFTGLKDKNGQEIYEGDILVYGQWVALVLWNKELATFALQFDFEKEVGMKPLGEWQTMEIVGNIHDNPELLKGGEK